MTTGDTVPRHETLHTGCGRVVQIGRLSLPGPDVERVTVDVARQDQDDDKFWMSLTPEEARDLALRLTRQAVAAEAAGAPAAASAARGAITVTPLAGHAYVVAARGHQLVVDQPLESHGTDMGLQPLELFVGGLAACVATYAGGYLSRHGIAPDGLRVTCEYELASDRPARVGSVRIAIQLPDGVPPAQRAPLLAVARHCTAHNTLQHPPAVEIELA